MFFPVNMRVRPLTQLHEISTARDWFQILLCPNRRHIWFPRDGTFFKFSQSILTANLVHMDFSANSMSSKHPQNHIVPEVQGGFLSGHNFQNFDFWGARNFLRIFSPSFRWVLPVAWPRAAAAEATHRCTSQPTMATIPWWSGSWRRRRLWMQRPTTAVASEEDIGGETSWGLGIPLRGSEWRCWCFTDGSTFWWILFSQFVGKTSKHLRQCLVLLFMNTTILFLHFGSEFSWLKGFSLEIECHAHHNSNCFWGSGVSILMWYIIKHCLTGSLFAVLINRRNLCFFQLICELGLLHNCTKYLLHGTDFKFCCVPIAGIFGFLETEHFFSFLKAFWLPTWFTWTFQPTRCHQNILKTTLFLKFREDFWVATISKTSTFEVPEIFSEFSPLRSVGFCLWLGLGPRLLRQHTAALRSLQRPRFRGGAAPGGEGDHGCAGQRQPWPRRRILVGKPHEALGFRCEEVNEDVDVSLMVQLFGSFSWILFSQFVGKTSKHLRQCLVLLFVNTTIYNHPEVDRIRFRCAQGPKSDRIIRRNKKSR